MTSLAYSSERVKHDEEMSICSSTPQAHKGYINSSLLEDDLKMSKSHASVQSYDESVSYLSSMANLYEQKEHFLMSEAATENRANIETIDKITRHQRTYVATQDNKHCSKDLRTDSSLNTGRIGHEKYRNGKEVSQSLLVNMPSVTENHQDWHLRKSLKCSKKGSQV